MNYQAIYDTLIMTKGKVDKPIEYYSERHHIVPKARMGEGNPMFGKKNPSRYQRVQTPEGEFESMIVAANSTGLNRSTIRNRIKRGVEGYSYLG